MKNDLPQTPLQELPDNGKRSLRVGVESKNHSRSAKLFVRIAIFAFFIFQSLAIIFHMGRSAFISAMNGSQPFMSESALTRTLIAFGMLILIGVVCVGWIVPSRPLPNQRNDSVDKGIRTDWRFAALILLRIIVSALFIGFACAITFGGALFGATILACSGGMAEGIIVPILIVVIGAWIVSIVLIALIWIFGWKRR